MNGVESNEYTFCPYPDCNEVVYFIKEEIAKLSCRYEHKFCGQCHELVWHDDPSFCNSVNKKIN